MDQSAQFWKQGPTEFNPIAELPALKKLNLAFTRIDDLAVLARLSTLKELDLTSTPVKSFAPLAHLRCLNCLNLWDVFTANDFTPLENLT